MSQQTLLSISVDAMRQVHGLRRAVRIGRKTEQKHSRELPELWQSNGRELIHKIAFEGGMELSLIKALVVSMAISAVWYGMEWMQYQELQWDRKCDNVVWALYLVVLWWLFAHQN